jgi:uncharacterized protein
MLRWVLILILVIFVVRALWRLLEGMIDGIAGPRRSSQPPQQGVQMVRDPVCGTFVVPSRAVTLAQRGEQVYFCSPRCRDQYRARTA